MNLVIDVGNTRIKYAFFEGNDLREVGYDMDILISKLKVLRESHAPVSFFLSGSGIIDEKLKQTLLGFADFALDADPLMELPLRLGYHTPQTLGFDRIAVCAGAMSLYPGKNLLVINSGTAITYNYVNESGVFIGGNISPGVEIRFRSLHQYTAKLPYVEAQEEYGGVGLTTPDAIRNGVMLGMLYEVKGYIEDFRQTYANTRVIISGGNSSFLKRRLPDTVCFNENLGFIGLNDILEYHKRLK